MEGAQMSRTKDTGSDRKGKACAEAALDGACDDIACGTAIRSRPDAHAKARLSAIHDIPSTSGFGPATRSRSHALSIWPT
jgi:hypothetical protein